jgi:hypothetical protein
MKMKKKKKKKKTTTKKNKTKNRSFAQKKSHFIRRDPAPCLSVPPGSWLAAQSGGSICRSFARALQRTLRVRGRKKNDSQKQQFTKREETKNNKKSVPLMI